MSGAMPLPRAASGSVALLHLGYLANVTNKDHTDFLSVFQSEYTLMTECHAELAGLTSHQPLHSGANNVMETGELVLPLSWEVQESWQADQLSYHSGPDSGL